MRVLSICLLLAVALTGCSVEEFVAKGLNTSQPSEAGLVASKPAESNDAKKAAASNKAGNQSNTVPIPEWKIGESWTYSDGYGLEVTEITPEGLTRFRMLDDPDQWMSRRAFFVEVSKTPSATRTTVFRTADPMQLFSAPLGTEIAYIREVMKDKELLRHRTSWIVEGKERVTVPAGTFDCLLIVMRSVSMSSSYNMYERWWYSPVAKAPVRVEYRYGDGGDSSRVLMKYTLK